MHGFLQRVLQRVGLRERSEVSEHDVLQAHRFQHRLEHHGAFFQLGCDKQEEADHGQPGAVGVASLRVLEHTHQHEQRRERLTDRNCTARGADRVHAAAEYRAEYSAAVHGVGRQQVEQREPEVGPDQAARQIAGMHVRLCPELNLGRHRQ